MAINKRAKNIYIHVKDTYTSISGKLEIIAESINITATHGDLILASNKKIVVEGKDGGVKFGDYTSPQITNICWMDESETYLLEKIEDDQIATLVATTSGYIEGQTVTFNMENEDTNEIIDLSGTVDSDNKVRIKWKNISKPFS